MTLAATPSALFPKEIETSLEAVRDRSRALIDSVCGGTPRAKDVAERFRLHAKLGWQLWNVAYSNPLVALRFLPNPHGIRAISEAAYSKGVPPEVVGRFVEAAEELDRVMGTHAEDREMFEMLVDAHEAASEEGEMRWRKQAFAGNSFTFGARAKCMLATGILYPSSTEGSFSMVRLHGLIDLVRTRAGVRWPFATLVVQHGNETRSPRREPLDPSSRVVPILPEYCSKPLPPIERRTEGEMISDELLPGLVGLTGASTLFTGEILHDLGPIRSHKEGESAYFGTGCRTPAELLVSDHIVHRSLFPNARRELRVFSELVSVVTRDDRDQISVSETLQQLGSGLQRVRTADVPNYGELLEETFRRIGFDPEEFDIYRVRMRYPPIPASVMVKFPLPGPNASI